jgi:protein subunit release factor B
MSNRELLFSVTLKDCDVQTKRGSGPGGQHRNKTDSAVRIVHRASGATGESQQERSQLLNKRLAFKRLTETAKFKMWLAQEAYIRQGNKSPEQRVKEMMEPANLRTEVKVDGKWSVIDPEDLMPA